MDLSPPLICLLPLLHTYGESAVCSPVSDSISFIVRLGYNCLLNGLKIIQHLKTQLKNSATVCLWDLGLTIKKFFL